jgi:hypothetical protein
MESPFPEALLPYLGRVARPTATIINFDRQTNEESPATLIYRLRPGRRLSELNTVAPEVVWSTFFNRNSPPSYIILPSGAIVVLESRFGVHFEIRDSDSGESYVEVGPQITVEPSAGSWSRAVAVALPFVPAASIAPNGSISDDMQADMDDILQWMSENQWPAAMAPVEGSFSQLILDRGDYNDRHCCSLAGIRTAFAGGGIWGRQNARVHLWAQMTSDEWVALQDWGVRDLYIVFRVPYSFLLETQAAVVRLQSYNNIDFDTLDPVPRRNPLLTLVLCIPEEQRIETEADLDRFMAYTLPLCSELAIELWYCNQATWIRFWQSPLWSQNANCMTVTLGRNFLSIDGRDFQNEHLDAIPEDWFVRVDSKRVLRAERIRPQLSSQDMPSFRTTINPLITSTGETMPDEDRQTRLLVAARHIIEHEPARFDVARQLIIRASVPRTHIARLNELETTALELVQMSIDVRAELDIFRSEYRNVVKKQISVDAEVEALKSEIWKLRTRDDAGIEEMRQVRARDEARDEEMRQLRARIAARDEEMRQLRARDAARDEEMQQTRAQDATRDEEMLQLRARDAARDEELRQTMARDAARDEEMQQLRARDAAFDEEMQRLRARDAALNEEMQQLRALFKLADIS